MLDYRNVSPIKMGSFSIAMLALVGVSHQGLIAIGFPGIPTHPLTHHPSRLKSLTGGYMASGPRQ